MVNLPINICHCPGNFPSSSKVIYSQFFHKWKFQKISSGQRQFRFIYPTGSFAKSQETLCEQLRNTHEIIQTKTDSLPQIFALDLYKAIMTALTEIFCINIKNCRSKSGNDYQDVLKKKRFRSRKLSSGQFDFSFDYGTEKCAEFWKGFGQPTSRNSHFFPKIFLEGLLET